jgi:hypothetical protein
MAGGFSVINVKDNGDTGQSNHTPQPATGTHEHNDQQAHFNIYFRLSVTGRHTVGDDLV